MFQENTKSHGGSYFIICDECKKEIQYDKPYYKNDNKHYHLECVPTNNKLDFLNMAESELSNIYYTIKKIKTTMQNEGLALYRSIQKLNCFEDILQEEFLQERKSIKRITKQLQEYLHNIVKINMED